MIRMVSFVVLEGQKLIFPFLVSWYRSTCNSIQPLSVCYLLVSYIERRRSKLVALTELVLSQSR